jgi:phage FluMu protein Com
MSCGNKTDECPKCRKYIRRAVFAYHYENNCANLDDADTPTPRSRNSSAHHNSNRPAVGEDNDNYRPKVSEKSNYLFYFHISGMFLSFKGSSPDTIKCQFCNHLFTPVDHKIHQVHIIPPRMTFMLNL